MPHSPSMVMNQLGFRTISNECGPFEVGKYEAQDSSIAYCMNQERFGPSTPGGPWLTYNQGWVWLEDEFAAIICHGYPTATSFGGHNLSPDRARAATQLAVWMLNGTTHTDGSFSYTPPGASQRGEIFPATMRSLPQRAGSTTAPSREALKPHRIARGAIWELCRAAVNVKTCSTCSRRLRILPKTVSQRRHHERKRYLQARRSEVRHL